MNFKGDIMHKETRDYLAESTLVFGILGQFFCLIPILGIIFSLIGISKSNAFEAYEYKRSGLHITGKILSIAALAQNIVVIGAFILAAVIIFTLLLFLPFVPIDYNYIY